MSDNTFPEMLRRLAARFTPATIIDVGASDGRWSRMAHEVWPEAKLALIEANPVFRPQLECFWNEHKKSYVWFDLAGERIGTARVRFAHDDPFQGVYPAGDEGAEVNVASIDFLTSPTLLPGPYLIKLDVHGREHEILSGARETLKHTGAIVAEVYTWSQGPNSMRAAELIPHIEREHGFLPSDLCEPLRRPLDGRLVQVDMLFEPRTAPLMDTARYR